MSPPAPKKRRRKRDNASNPRSRPPPPPPPPAALVQLLQSDEAVVHYFQSLQANLEADVQVWKNRALQWEAQNKELMAERMQQQNNGNGTLAKRKPLKARGSTKKKKAEDDSPAANKGSQKHTKKSPSKPAAAANGGDGGAGAESSSSEHAADGRQSNKPPAAPVAQALPEVGLPIDDSVFDDEDDSSDEDNSTSFMAARGAYHSNEHHQQQQGAIMRHDRLVDMASSDNEADCDRAAAAATAACNNQALQEQRQVFGLLQEAYEALSSLGIALVDVTTSAAAAKVETVETATPDQEAFAFGDDDSVEAPLAPVKITPRTDESVMMDIVDRIRNNTLAPKPTVDPADGHETNSSTHEEDAYCALVHSDQLLLCCNPTTNEDDTEGNTHPLLRGKHLLLRALAILDTFCSPILLQQEWEAYFHHSTDRVKEIRIGLRGRKSLVDRLVRRLGNAVSGRWACSDRSLRLTATALHYQKFDNAVMHGAAKEETVMRQGLLGDRTSRSILGMLVERCTFSQLSTALYFLRKQLDRAALNVLQYVVSTAPTISIEDYPKLPPVLSVVSLEGLLLLGDPKLMLYNPQNCDGSMKSDDEKSSASWFSRQVRSWSSRDDDKNILKTVALAVHASASIWYDRLESTDDRIHDVAAMELASYHRLLKYEVSWLHPPAVATSDLPLTYSDLQTLLAGSDWQEQARHLLNNLLDTTDSASHDDVHGENCRSMALQIALIVHGDANVLDKIFRESIVPVKESILLDDERQRSLNLLLVSTRAKREIVLRQLDMHRRQIGFASGGRTELQDFSSLFDLIWNCAKRLSISERLLFLRLALQCSCIVVDGTTSLRAMERVIQTQNDHPDETPDERGVSDLAAKTLFDTIRRLGEIPAVRVINLERRKDRMKAFASQAFREGLLLYKAVTYFRDTARSDDPDERISDGFECGLNAVDGQGRLVEATERLVQHVGGTIERLNKIVETHWRPNDLKPFDRDAPDVETMARMSPSERACALSHVGSWQGILRSLQLPEPAKSLSLNESKMLLRYPNHIRRLFKISGFAEGPALLTKNDNMPPAPVCVILEDDAILVDGFAEKLVDLFKELPRDFHFCSLGYSRPKSAPIVPFSSKLGIPSMLWYLTGYCLSEQGAKYLLDSLPVVGPVDSWVGLKMTSNWDNVFGERLGVGVHSQPHSEVPAHKDLCRIMTFRAYCALVPLCTQKVRVETSAGTVVAAASGRNWRQRDTDIEYSGAMVLAAKRR